jgi:hypothetical protein
VARRLLVLFALLGLLIAAGLGHRARERTSPPALPSTARACACGNADCDCVGVCDCERAGCCSVAVRAEEPAPARIVLGAQTAQPPARARLCRKRCGSQGEARIAGSSSGPPALARAWAAPAPTPKAAPRPPSTVGEPPDTRRPAPPSPPPERIVT